MQTTKKKRKVNLLSTPKIEMVKFDFDLKFSNMQKYYNFERIAK